MKKFTLSFALAFICLLFQFNGFSQSSETSIAWDEWGVPHITSENVQDLFFAQGWAQMHNHANHILKLYGTSRGRAAEYWGPDHVSNDMIVHTLGFGDLADNWQKDQDPESAQIFESFVKGLNAYAQAHPEAIDPANKNILPVTVKDALMHSMFVIFTRFISGRELQISQQWPDLGSNTIAIGPSKSANGNAMLIQNPHLPWYGEFLFFESHLMLNEKNMYGATLVGLPGIAIGFNKNLGWSHTNNVIDNSDLYELSLQDNGYLMDGELENFEVTSAKIKIKQEDGTLTTQEIPVMKTKFGPVVKVEGDKALAIRMVGLDRPDMLLQWWKMINSHNFEEFEDALKMSQIPFWNVMYADKEGNLFYLFNGLIPERERGDWSYWRSLVKGGESKDLWTNMHSYEDLPKVKNPATGWLQNANDPPWTSTLPRAIESSSYPAYFSPDEMYFRAQGATKLITEHDKISFDELVDIKHSTRLELAHRIVDDLIEAIDSSPSPLLNEAKEVLEDWDLKADSDSEGTLLFYLWAKNFNVFRNDTYAKPWDIEKPNLTPDGLANPEEALSKLEETVKLMKEKFGNLDVKWGDYYKIRNGNELLPGNGMDGWAGIFRVAWSGDEDDNHEYITGGDSWVGVIEFDETPKAKVLLSYGNATQSNSPHKGDQLKLFSDKELRDAYFTKEEVEKHSKKRMILKNGKFVEN